VVGGEIRERRKKEAARGETWEEEHLGRPIHHRRVPPFDSGCPRAPQVICVVLLESRLKSSISFTLMRAAALNSSSSYLSATNPERRSRGMRECWQRLGLGVASVVCSICIRVTCEATGDGPAYGQDGLGGQPITHFVIFPFFFSLFNLYFLDKS
jgi:hypothetical protein